MFLPFLEQAGVRLHLAPAAQPVHLHRVELGVLRGQMAVTTRVHRGGGAEPCSPP